MPRPRASEPLVPLRTRIQRSRYDVIAAAAAASGQTVSDYVRQHIHVLNMGPPTGVVPPRKRPQQLAPARASDSRVLRELARIGNNINQLARNFNATRAAGERFDLIDALTQLAVIERHLRALADIACQAE